jgi:hypothetical protein
MHIQWNIYNFFFFYFTMRRLFGVEYENDCVICIKKIVGEAVVACCNILSQNCLKGLEKLKESVLRDIQRPCQKLNSQSPE